MRDGVIADFEIAEEMIKHFIRKVHNRRSFANPMIIVCVPSGSTAVERRAIQESALVGRRAPRVPHRGTDGGGDRRRACPCPNPPAPWSSISAAARPKWPCSRSAASSIRARVRVGGDKMDEAIIAYIRRHQNLLIGEASAERIKKEIGSAAPPAEGNGVTLEIKGRDLLNGVPKEITITQTPYRRSAGRTDQRRSWKR